MATAQDRGWGPGWPKCQYNRIATGFAVKTKQGTIRFPGGIRAELVELTDRLVRETANRGYRFGRAGDPSYGCWGYNCRAISGTSKPSNHSWGLAVDINAPSNPYKYPPVVTDMPGWMPDLWNAYGWRWGGDYSSGKVDAMHYEFMGTPAQAKSYTDKARANHLGEEGEPPVTDAEMRKTAQYVWDHMLYHRIALKPDGTPYGTDNKRKAGDMIGYINRNAGIASCLQDSQRALGAEAPYAIDRRLQKMQRDIDDLTKLVKLLVAGQSE